MHSNPLTCVGRKSADAHTEYRHRKALRLGFRPKAAEWFQMDNTKSDGAQMPLSHSHLALGWPEAQPTLSLDGVHLRPFRPQDAHAVYEACSDAEIQRWLPVPEPWTPAAAAAYITEYADTWWASGRGAVFAVVDAQDAAIGSVDLDHVNAHSLTAEIGYWLSPAAQHAGIMTRAVNALVQWALTDGGLHRVEFRVDPQNGASLQLLHRVGATFEGTLRGVFRDRTGNFRDKSVFSILQGEATFRG